jgi:hypothetical protein
MEAPVPSTSLDDLALTFLAQETRALLTRL